MEIVENAWHCWKQYESVDITRHVFIVTQVEVALDLFVGVIFEVNIYILREIPASS